MQSWVIELFLEKQSTETTNKQLSLDLLLLGFNFSCWVTIIGKGSCSISILQLVIDNDVLGS